MEIKLIDKSNFTRDSLKGFRRYQEVKNVYRLKDGNMTLVCNPFTEDWDAARLLQKAEEILKGKYVTYCAFEKNCVVGEIMLIPQLNKGRLIIDSFHVSRDYRRRGIGKSLLEAARQEALKRGAYSLYASCCSAEETINFYSAMGFRLSSDPIPSLVKDEPYDLQMECMIFKEKDYLKNVMRDSVTSFTIRRLSEDERQTALDLAWAVFSEYESPDYPAEGTEEFRKCLHDEGYLSGLHYYGTFDGEKLIGEIAIRPDRKHICFFFVDGRYHRRGIGTRMFRRLLDDYPNETITLNSSPYGLPFYKAIGFVPTDEEKTVNGIRFTPMKYEGRQVSGKPTERNERIEESVMKELVLYIHGKGGNAEESEHYKPLFPECEVVGLNYQTFTPWETGKEILEVVTKMNTEYDSITLIANSVGAFFSMNAGIDAMICSAFFISPIVDMEQLILNMMTWANVTERELEEKGVIHTSFGEDLSWEYLCYVREHPVSWTVPTRILYGSRDNLTSYETISAFAKIHGAELTVMEEGEHWFHTEGQMRFLDNWIKKGRSNTLPS